MTNMIKTLANVKGLGEVVEVSGALYSELQQLKEAKARLISPRDEAFARIETAGRGKKDRSKILKIYGLHVPGTRTISGFEYIKGELPIFTAKSRIFENTEKLETAIDAKKAYFDIRTTMGYRSLLEQAEEDKEKEPEKRQVIVLPSRKDFEISPTENWEVLQTILGDQAEAYFDLHKRVHGVLKPIPVHLAYKDRVDSQNGTLLSCLYFALLLLEKHCQYL